MVLAVVVLLGAVAVLVVVLLLQPRVSGVLPLAYVARAQGALLGDAGSAAMEAALRDGVVPFRVDGEARTRWKVAGIIGVDQWTRLACQLRFFWPNGTVLPFRCISKSKFLFF
ncbi:late embryogenesis abundant protein [Zea mays]|uniref:Late embryogenesis abundant protein n=2 Tax=Zea mays TaxID=4577 RepID=A0A1D6EFT6_MAIZE|nr:late embryogenesis abundant protein [Zea mays]